MQRLDNLSVTDTDIIRKDFPDKTTNTDNTVVEAPEHILETEYRYNSLNQLVYQNTPDGGESRFAYDALGRLVLSQNAKQKVNDQYSYTRYDALGRVIEVGELTKDITLGTDIHAEKINENGQFVVLGNGPNGIYTYPWDGVNDELFPSNMSSQREEVTRTIYDEFNGASISVNLGGSSTQSVSAQSLFSNYSFDNTRNRIVAVIYQDFYKPSINNYENATYYDYDVHGNVKELIQVNYNGLLYEFNQHIKHFEYEYDLVSGNVNKVVYQKNQPDQFIHRYVYDSDNRITIAETSKDGVIYEKDAKYFYYDHGPLARTEIGEQKVQASDYAYTIQGWLKTVNGEQVSEQTMMGQDGKMNTSNAMGARDAHGFSLKYFVGDYGSSNAVMLNLSNTNNYIGNLYNGNIRSMYTALSDEDELNIGTHQTQYSYDQLNRIKSMSGSDGVGNSSGYSSSYVFDENGNLESLKRKAAGQAGYMDDLVYNDDDDPLTGFNNGENNRLSSVDDLAGASLFGDADLSGLQNLENYQYDEIGQLTSDAAEGITDIKWKVTNKVEEIVKSDGEVIKFEYDAMGNRIAKYVYTNSPTSVNGSGEIIEVPYGLTATFYILDAQGNPMSTYKYTHTALSAPGVPNDELYLVERNIYGSSRVGTEYPSQLMGEADLVNVAVVDFNALNYLVDNTVYCSTGGNIGVWEYNTPPYNYAYTVIDQNGDSVDDLVVNNTTTTSTSTATVNGSGNLLHTSVQLMINTVPGEDYTMNFDLLGPFNHEYTDVYALSCAGNGILGNVLATTADSYSMTFTANTDVTRIKWLNRDPNGLSDVALSNVSFMGVGDILGTGTIAEPLYYVASNEIGDKRYELSNHLGNVLEVVTDRKLPEPTLPDANGDVFVDYYLADVVAYSDYYPYGMLMPGRHANVDDLNNDGYRYGFQGQEMDDEIKDGRGNSVNYKYRMHDPRVGRFFAVDPLAGKYPFNSPYVFSQNMVISGVELEGLEVTPSNEIWKLSKSVTSSVGIKHIDFESGNQIAKIHGGDVILLKIGSGPNKGNFAGYTLGEGTTIKDFYDVFVNGVQMNGELDAKLSYIVGGDRVPEKVFTGDLGSVSTGSVVLSGFPDYEYSSELGGIDGVEALNDNLIGYFDKETAEWVDTGEFGDYFYEKVFTPWKEIVTDPTNYTPGSNLKIKGKGSMSGMTQFKKSTAGTYTGSNKKNLKEGYQQSISKDAKIDIDPNTDPVSSEESEGEN